MRFYHSSSVASGLLLSIYIGGAVVTADVQSATVFAEEYGIPLDAYKSLAEPLLLAIGKNVLFRNTELATPGTGTVVAPNVDTLYGAALLDLASDDVEVTVPDIGDDRYFSFAFYDPYGSNYVAIGSTTDLSPGKYYLRRASDANVPWGYSSAAAGGYLGYINSPTTQGTLLIRILVKNNGTDLEEVQSLLADADLAAIPRTSSPGGAATPLKLSTFAGLGSANSTAVLRLLARLHAANPPFNVSDPSGIASTLAEAGIHDGVYDRPAGAQPNSAYQTALANIDAYAAGPGNVSLNHGWAYTAPQGLFGDAFRGRAATAIGLYLAQVEAQAFYPRWRSGTDMVLAAGEAYVYTFSTRPPLGPQGFWSLTLYGPDGLLVENPQQVYAVGDRSNITYPDGVCVYGPEGAGRDDEFQVLVQRSDEPPPANWTANWLPAPSDESSFTIAMRLYEPTDEVKEATWEYPSVTMTTAVTS